MGDTKVIIVTGAGGELGSRIAQRFALDGAKVVAFERTEELLQAEKKRWHSLGLEIDSREADQVSFDDVSRAVDSVVEHYGTISGLVANAGYAKFGDLLGMEPSVWDRHVAVNLSGTFYMLQAVARHMATGRGGGWITVISSNLAMGHNDQVAPYVVTKGALLQLVRSAAAELGVYRIRVNAVLPGVVETAMTRQMLNDRGTREGLLSKTPMGRFGAPDDVADAVAFLSSRAADWISGASLLVDGGQSIYGQPAWRQQDRRREHEPRWLPGYSIT